MTGTFLENTELSATSATPDQTLTMVAGGKRDETTIVLPGVVIVPPMFYGYDDGTRGDRGVVTGGSYTPIGTLEPNVIRFNGAEYVISYYLEKYYDGFQGSSIGFTQTPPFSKMKLLVNDVEVTAIKGTSGAETRTFTVSGSVPIENDTTYTIKVVSIE